MEDRRDPFDGADAGGSRSNVPLAACRRSPMNPGALVPIVIVSAFGAVGFTEFPRNDLPQPYRTTRDWGQLPPGVKWAAVTAIEPAPDGTIYVIHRCFANSCAGRPEAPILKYDASGRLLKSWGEGLFNFPHGATVDRDGNLWVTDRSEEHTSELQSRQYLVCRLLLEKK